TGVERVHAARADAVLSDGRRGRDPDERNASRGVVDAVVFDERRGVGDGDLKWRAGNRPELTDDPDLLPGGVRAAEEDVVQDGTLQIRERGLARDRPLSAGDRERKLIL